VAATEEVLALCDEVERLRAECPDCGLMAIQRDAALDALREARSSLANGAVYAYQKLAAAEAKLTRARGLVEEVDADDESSYEDIVLVERFRAALEGPAPAPEPAPPAVGSKENER